MNDVYRPRFTWNADNPDGPAILDGGVHVASFYGGADELPAPHGKAVRPVSLHNLRLAPNGPIAIREGEHCGPLCLSWRKHLMFNMQVQQLEADDSDPECFRLYVRTIDNAMRKDLAAAADYEPGNMTEESWLELTYDAAQGSYLFDVRTRMTVTPGREQFVLGHDHRGLEFGDLLPAGAKGAFPPNGDKRFTHVVYAHEDGRTLNRPQNRHLGPDKTGIDYAANGWIAYVAEPGPNPIVEFLDGTGSLVQSELCWSMYDVHFECRRDRVSALLRAGDPIEVAYRLSSITRQRAAALLADSEPDPVLDEAEVPSPPFVQDGVNTFTPSDEYRQPSDCWFWHCSDPSCYWCWDVGHRTPGALAIARHAAEIKPRHPGALWTFIFGYSSDGRTRSQWDYLKLSGRSAYRITAMVRTQEVVGDAFLALQYYRPIGDDTAALPRDSEPIFSAQTLDGSRDWTQLTLETPADMTRPYQLAGLFLALEGAGRCWFDEVAITPMPLGAAAESQELTGAAAGS